MLLGRISFNEQKNIVLHDLDGRQRIWLTIQGALDLASWVEEHRKEMLACLQQRPEERGQAPQ